MNSYSYSALRANNLLLLLQMTLSVTCIHVKHGRYNHIESATMNLLPIKLSVWQPSLIEISWDIPVKQMNSRTHQTCSSYLQLSFEITPVFGGIVYFSFHDVLLTLLEFVLVVFFLVFLKYTKHKTNNIRILLQTNEDLS